LSEEQNELNHYAGDVPWSPPLQSGGMIQPGYSFFGHDPREELVVSPFPPGTQIHPKRTEEPMKFVVLSKDAAREFIREEVDKALHPGLIDPRVYMHVTLTDPTSGHTFRGLVYLVEPTQEEV
jgi:hypothetical protein